MFNLSEIQKILSQIYMQYGDVDINNIVYEKDSNDYELRVEFIIKENNKNVIKGIAVYKDIIDS